METRLRKSVNKEGEKTWVRANELPHAVLREEVRADLADAIVADRAESLHAVDLRGAEDLGGARSNGKALTFWRKDVWKARSRSVGRLFCIIFAVCL